MKARILFAFLLFLAMPAMAQEIKTGTVPEEVYRTLHNDDYTVLVRSLPDGQWQDLYEYKVLVNDDRITETSVVMFDFSGEVEVMVRKNNGTAHEAVIRPLSYGIKHKMKDNVLRFRLSQPRNLSIEFDGDRLHNLHLFANAPEVDVPGPDDAGVMYFGPGIHTPADGTDAFRIPSDTRVYLAPGAILNGTLLCESVENVRIGGRGLIIPKKEFTAVMEMYFSKNIILEDLTGFNDMAGVICGQCDNVKISNFHVFSHLVWGDGINMRSCNNVHISDAFIRTSDDCIAVYGSRFNAHGDSRNIVVENSVLWADVAHPINIGTHGDVDRGGDVLSDFVFRNIDILGQDEDVPVYEGCMAISCGDMNHISNILFEDIRVECIEEGQLFHFDVVQNAEFCKAPGRGIENVTLRNITCPFEPNVHRPSIEGYDPERVIKNVVIENVRIGGRKLKSVDDLRVNEFVKDIIFK